jgi:hypothetical protein
MSRTVALYVNAKERDGACPSVDKAALGVSSRTVEASPMIILRREIFIPGIAPYWSHTVLRPGPS